MPLLHDVLDVAAAETYVVDCGFDASTDARRVDETNRERAKRGESLSGRDEQAEDESAESELVPDMLAIVTSFAGRPYGQCSAKTKRLRAAVSAETECGDAA